MSKKKELYTITCTREQLGIIANCVEDCHRFAAGQLELSNTIGACFHKGIMEFGDEVKKLQPIITPELPQGSYYKWSGGGCPNDSQRKFIAMTYGIYREIYHQMRELNYVEDRPYSVYDSKTLTCEEMGGLPIIEKVKK